MSIRSDARQSIKYVARDALSERWQHLLRFTAPASLIVAGTYVATGALTPDLSGLETLGEFSDYVYGHFFLFAVSYLLQLLLKGLMYGPLVMCIAAFFLPRSAPEALAAERKLYRSAPPGELPAAQHNFSWFLDPSRLLCALRYWFAVTLVRLAARIVCFVPGIALLLAGLLAPQTSPYISARLSLGAGLLLIGYMLSEIFVARYVAVPFLLAQDGTGVRRAMRDSSEMMRGRLFEYFLFNLSFIPWYIIALATFGVGLVYVIPYRAICEAMFVRYADADGQWRMFETAA